MGLSLMLGSDQYINFKSVSILISMLQPAISFTFGSSKQNNLKIFTGSKVSVFNDNELLCEGFINLINKTTDTEIDNINFAGRSLIADIIDCTVPENPANWEQATPKIIINDLLKPFGITADFPEKINDKIDFSTKPGDKVFTVIQELLSRFNFISFEKTPGVLTVTKAVSSGTIGSLKFGNTNDILKLVEYQQDDTNRFSVYNVVGDAGVIFQTETKGQAKDETIKRFRPLTIQLEGDVTNEQCQQRAEYERTIADANSLSFSYLVPSWTGPDNKTWQPNTLINIIDDDHNLNGEYLLVSVTLKQNLKNKTALLKFAPPKSFTAAPPVEPTKDFLLF